MLIRRKLTKRRNRELHIKSAAKTNARDETFSQGMNIFRENEKMTLEDHLLLGIENFPRN